MLPNIQLRIEIHWVKAEVHFKLGSRESLETLRRLDQPNSNSVLHNKENPVESIWVAWDKNKCVIVIL